MWPFRKEQNNFLQQSHLLLSARPHPSRLLRVGGRRKHNEQFSDTTQHQPDKLAIILREDMKLSPGKAAQYAATIAVRIAQKTCRGKHACRAWKQAKERSVVLNAPNRKSLIDLISLAKQFHVSISLLSARGDPHVALAVLGHWADVDALTKGLKHY